MRQRPLGGAGRTLVRGALVIGVIGILATGLSVASVLMPSPRASKPLAPQLMAGLDSWSAGSPYVSGWVEATSAPCQFPVIWVDNGMQSARYHRRGWIMASALASGSRETWSGDPQSDAKPVGPFPLYTKPSVVAICARPITPS